MAAFTCCKCGMPISGNHLWVGNAVFHPQCFSKPSSQEPLAIGLSEDDVRRIVREELDRALRMPERLEKIIEDLPAHAATAVRRSWTELR